jgi:hypothetical protein
VSVGAPVTDYFVEVKMHNDVWQNKFVNDDVRASDPLIDTIKLPAYGVYDIRVAAESSGGRSTYGTVRYVTADAVSYAISNCGELRAINADPESGYADNYDLVADIDCSGSDFPAIGWHETGFITAGAFSGIFNGHDHTINNIAIVDGGGDGRGFFADAMNATLENFKINGTLNSGGIRIGGIVGLGQNITVTNITSSLVMTDSTAAGFGGIVGGLITNYGTSDVSNNSVLGSVTAMSGVTVGGLIGVVDMYNGGTLTMNNNTVSGNVTGLSDSVGGLVGDLYIGLNTDDSDSSIVADHNVVTGSVDSTTGGFVGGLIGSFEQTSTMNSVSDLSITNSSVSGAVSCEGTDSYVGGLIGHAQSEADGSGAVNFTLTGNSYTGVAVNGNTNEYVGGLIGYYGVTESSGTGHITYALHQNFSTANVTGSGYLGGLIGAIAHDEEGTTDKLISGTISESYASGTVTDPYGSGNVGGFLGNFMSNVSNDNQLIISDAYASGNVSSLGAAVGGLVGSQYATGLVIRRTYASGSVTGSGTGDSGGGLVGYLGIGNVADSFSTGVVSGFATQAGGLIGGSNDSSFTNLFYDSTLSGQSLCMGTGGVGADCTAVSSATFKNSATNPPYFGGATDWDFITIWQMHTSGYPTLQLFTATPILTEVTAIPSQITTESATYSFSISSDVAGSYVFETCSTTPHLDESAHMIVFSGLQVGQTYECGIHYTVSDSLHSNTLHIGPFSVVTPTVVNTHRGNSYAVMGSITPQLSTPVTLLQTQTQPILPKASSGALFIKDLKKGMTDPEVQKLQVFLNTHGFLVSLSGIGSPGKESSFFGTKTFLAVIQYQKAHTIFPQSGYVGLLSKASINQLLTAGQ